MKKDIPFETVLCDRESIRQIIGNLLDNAIKFTKQMPMARIQITGKETAADWHLCISDNGIGFDSKYKEQIFTIFQRLHLPEEYPGTGVGLAIVQKAISRIGGKVWAESDPGKGAAFYLQVPKFNLENQKPGYSI